MFAQILQRALFLIFPGRSQLPSLLRSTVERAFCPLPNSPSLFSMQRRSRKKEGGGRRKTTWTGYLGGKTAKRNNLPRRKFWRNFDDQCTSSTALVNKAWRNLAWGRKKKQELSDLFESESSNLTQSGFTFQEEEEEEEEKEEEEEEEIEEKEEDE